MAEGTRFARLNEQVRNLDTKLETLVEQNDRRLLQIDKSLQQIRDNMESSAVSESHSSIPASQVITRRMDIPPFDGSDAED
ncbi:unnamed protein product [Sphenostylis stenocarpa]|uniref:Uncharacterized protein n=1 Tax=Sphenostylis stenocarpa TaxID=92480 RepID=A0AA86SA16_9FABA|nr:unnamed protein product [Sphenostylis stenocarpa]